MARPNNPPLDPADLERIGAALFGPQWVSPLAEALGVNRSTVTDWRHGRFSPPAGVRGELAARLDARAAECAPLAALLRNSSSVTVDG